MDYQKLINNLIMNDDLDLEEKPEYIELINYCWTLIINEEDQKLLEIKEIFEKEGKIKIYEKLKKLAKEYNEEFYDFEFLRNTSVPKKEKEELINWIFNNAILIDKRIINKYSSFNLEKEKVESLIYWIEYIITFSIENNYDGEKMIGIFQEYYKVDLSLLNELSKLYDENIIQLKLNYIIKKLNSIKN